MARKKAAKTKSVAKRHSSVKVLSPDDLREQMAALVNRDAVAAKGQTEGWRWARTKGGVLKLGDALLGDDGQSMDVVIVASILSNSYFDKPYSAGEQNSPVCAALDIESVGAEEMAPHSASPNPQSEECTGCWANAFSSALGGGKGKACRNSVTLAMLAPDDDFADADGLRLGIPPGSLSAWRKYAGRLSTLGAPTFCVITRVTIVPMGGAFGLTFEEVGPIDDPAALSALVARATGDARDVLIQAPSFGVSDEDDDAPAKPRGRVRAKRPVRKAGKKK